MICTFEQVTERDEQGEATFRCTKCQREVYHCKSESQKIFAHCRTAGERRPPTLLEMAASAAQAAEQYVASNGATVSGAVFTARMEICRACPMYGAWLNRCNDCGCFLALKAWLPDQDCRLGKWQAISSAASSCSRLERALPE